MANPSPSQSNSSFETIKFGIDAHARYYCVGSQLDGATPQSVQKMTYVELHLTLARPG